jgi:chromosome segregation ATPase
MADTTKIAAEIREILKALGPEGRDYRETLQSLEQTNAKVGTYKTLLENVRKTLNELNNDLDNTFNSWKNINNELTKAYSSVSLTKKGFGEYYKISNQLLYNQQNLSSVSKKELESLQKKAELNKKVLEQQFNEFKEREKRDKDLKSFTEAEKAAYKNLEGAFKKITGEIDVTNNIHELPVDGFRIQQEVPYDETYTEITESSQFKNKIQYLVPAIIHF